MFRSNLRWYFPQAPEEAAALLAGREVVPHAGGTGLLRAKPPGIRGLVDLSRLPLRTLRVEEREILLGGMLTFADLAGLEAANPAGPAAAEAGLRLLAQALSRAAATPLRNRITLGGSAADSPPWSDLAAPLLCLRADLLLLRPDGSCLRLPYEEYLAERNRLPAHLVREVIVGRGRVGAFALARLAMVRFDYAACQVAMAARLEDGRLEDPRVYVTGTRGPAARLEEVERAVSGRRPDAGTARRAAELAQADFASDTRFSAGYKARWMRIQVQDGLLRMGGTGHE